MGAISVPTSRIDTEHCRVVATGRARGSGGRGGEQQHPHHAFYYTGPAAGANSAVPSPPQQPSSFVGTLTIIPPPAADQAPPSADKKALAKVDERRIRMPTLCSHRQSGGSGKAELAREHDGFQYVLLWRLLPTAAFLPSPAS
jgi:hypothetical protein